MLFQNNLNIYYILLEESVANTPVPVFNEKLAISTEAPSRTPPPPSDFAQRFTVGVAIVGIWIEVNLDGTVMSLM